VVANADDALDAFAAEMSLRALGMLDRVGLRKIATDCGFDVHEDGADWVEAASTQAPLRVWIGLSVEGPVLGLSMSSVLTELPGTPIAVPATAAVPAVGWLQLRDLGALDRTLLHAWRLSRALPNQLEVRFSERLSTLSATERDATVRQRIGQDMFRDGLMTLWRGCCAISGLNVPELLRASHAKPWAFSSDTERLDVYNGLLLAAHLDAAFDCGLITIEAGGVVVMSPTLPESARTVLHLERTPRVALSPRHEPYMAWHREQVFRR
jgi:hypothetical protein